MEKRPPANSQNSWPSPIEVLDGGSRCGVSHKIYEKMLAGSRNLRFADFGKVAEAFGYRLDRTRGSHHIYEHPQAIRPLNLQNDRGQAKPYQIRQFLRDVEEFKLTMKD